MGRPTKLTKQVAEKIEAAIRAGNYAEAAARSAGIDPSTYYRWMERGESTKREDRPYREFREAIKKAEGEAEVHAVALVRKAMPDNWQAAMTYLERRYPDRWRRREAVELSGPDSEPVQIEVTDALLGDEARKAAASLRKRLAAARKI